MTTMTVPTTSEGLQELMSNPAELTKFFGREAAASGTTKQFLDAYAADYTRRNAQTGDEMKSQVQSVLFDMIRDAGGGKQPVADLGQILNFRGGRPQLSLPAGGSMGASLGKGTAYNRLAPGHLMSEQLKAEERFTALGEYFQAIRVDKVGAVNSAQQGLAAKLNAVRRFQDSFGSEDPGAGGFLIPEEMRSELLQLALEDTIVRQRALVIPMSTLRVPIPAVDDTSHVSSIFGGITFYWTEEAAALVESQAKFARVVLDAKKLTGFFKVPNELLADAPAFSAWLSQQMPRGLAWFEDLAFLTETGAGTPLGMIGAQNPAYVQVNRAVTNEVAYADLVTMYSRMLPTSAKNAVWIASIDVFPQLAQMSLATPGVWMGGYNVPGIADAPPVSIFGRPVYFTEKVPSLTSSLPGDISFVDPAFYAIGDRQAIAVSASEHAFFQNDQTAYKVVERVDGKPTLLSPLTPHNSGPTLSAYVGLSGTHAS